MLDFVPRKKLVLSRRINQGRFSDSRIRQIKWYLFKTVFHNTHARFRSIEFAIGYSSSWIRITINTFWINFHVSRINIIEHLSLFKIFLVPSKIHISLRKLLEKKKKRDCSFSMQFNLYFPLENTGIATAAALISTRAEVTFEDNLINRDSWK